jgi:hypothetical protein
MIEQQIGALDLSSHAYCMHSVLVLNKLSV